MKERPILFSADMVKAILEGRKSMTRRVVKPQPSERGCIDPKFGFTAATPPGHISYQGKCEIDGEMRFGEWFVKCPYGQVGDRLWVMEAWGIEYVERHGICPDYICIRYAADGLKCVHSAPGDEDRYAKYKDAPMHGPNRPSIFMPRWASRILLEIVSVRVERLQEISGEDALSEGALWDWSNDDFIDSDGYGITEANRGELAIEQFERLWQSINGKKHPWEANPWVFVIEFKVVSE